MEGSEERILDMRSEAAGAVLRVAWSMLYVLLRILPAR
jgi:hypothetical protein